MLCDKCGKDTYDPNIKPEAVAAVYYCIDCGAGIDNV